MGEHRQWWRPEACIVAASRGSCNSVTASSGAVTFLRIVSVHEHTITLSPVSVSVPIVEAGGVSIRAITSIRTIEILVERSVSFVSLNFHIFGEPQFLRRLVLATEFDLRGPPSAMRSSACPACPPRIVHTTDSPNPFSLSQAIQYLLPLAVSEGVCVSYGA